MADEIENLLEEGIDHIHICDSEFNIPENHAVEVCKGIIRRGFGEKVQWYAYCSPAPFSKKLAELIHRAGGNRHWSRPWGREDVKTTGRDFLPDDILDIADLCKEVGIACLISCSARPGKRMKASPKRLD